MPWYGYVLLVIEGAVAADLFRFFLWHRLDYFESWSVLFGVAVAIATYFLVIGFL